MLRDDDSYKPVGNMAAGGGGNRRGRDRSRSPRPHSRIVITTSSPNSPSSRLSRSHTMMSPPVSSPEAAAIRKPRSPTQVGPLSPRYLPKLALGSVGNSEFSSHANSRTLSPLQRSNTTAFGSNVYGRNMWDEDEYVDTGGNLSVGGTNSVPRTPTGGAAARRINQQRKMQAQTVKHPKNPFADPETVDDYADMTGHQRDESGMEELRSAHHHKSLKIRSQSTTRHPSETDSVGSRREASDVDLTRNVSVSSSRSGSQGSRFQRSNTSPGFVTQQNSLTRKFQDTQKNGSLRGVQPVIEEIDGAGSERNGYASSTTLSSLSRGENSLGNVSRKSPLPAASPAHSGVSVETSTTFIKQSVPVSPAVMYKSSDDNNTDNAQVAVVIEEIGPTSHMHASFTTQVGGQAANDKSHLKFETPPPKCQLRNVALIGLTLLLIFSLTGAVAYLAVTASQQSDKIELLTDQLQALLGSAVTTTAIFSEISSTARPVTKNEAMTISKALSTAGGVATTGSVFTAAANLSAATNATSTLTTTKATKDQTTEASSPLAEQDVTASSPASSLSTIAAMEPFIATIASNTTTVFTTINRKTTGSAVSVGNSTAT